MKRKTGILIFLSFWAFDFLFVPNVTAQVQLTAIPEGHFVTIPAAPPRPAEQTVKNRREQRRHLLALLSKLDVPNISENEPADRQWNGMARIFINLHLYPLAMKCYLKTLHPDSLVSEDVPFDQGDDLTIKNGIRRGPVNNKRSDNIIRVDSILQTFNDGKQALAYAMIFHVKQPVRGTAKVHKFIYTGHTFITLIKFNTDSTYATLSFGFGPHKDNLLAATPLAPSSPSKFTDDSDHAWDEVVGKFISRRRFEKILDLTRQYDGLAYHLSKNNCTDFGLKAAQLAGMKVKDTRGSWPLGSGNNPGNTGESILLGKFSNIDTGGTDRLFIDTAIAQPWR